MLRELIKLANHLDQKGLRKEADRLDRIIKRYATPNTAAPLVKGVSGTAYRVGTMYTPKAAKDWKKNNPDLIMLAPRGYSSFKEHWSYHFGESGGTRKMSWEEYQEAVKEFNPNLSDINKIIDGEAYYAPIMDEAEGSVEYESPFPHQEERSSPL